MYLCLCHAINERHVRDAADRGACCAKHVYKHLSVKPSCGKCVPYVEDLVRDYRGQATADPACPSD